MKMADELKGGGSGFIKEMMEAKEAAAAPVMEEAGPITKKAVFVDMENQKQFNVFYSRSPRQQNGILEDKTNFSFS